MSTPVRPELEPAQIDKAVQALKSQGAPDDAIHAYLQQTFGLKPVAAPGKHDFHAEYASGALQKRMDAANQRDAENAAEEPPSYAQQALGGIASLVKDIPGAEAAQAGARALVRGQSYRDALHDIQGAEASAPSVVRNFNRIAGGAVASSAMPGGPALSGARYGILSGLLQSDPDADIHTRIKSAAGRGAVGAVAGGLASTGTTLLRGALAKSSGAASAPLKEAIKAADDVNYGKATAEGNMPQPTPPAVAKAFSAPDIAPYVAEVRNSRTFAGANDATVLREAYKLMSERQGTLSNRIINANDYKAGTTLENSDTGLAKKQLLDAADEIMPSFRPAVAEHARLAGNRQTFQTMSDAAQRAIRGTSIAAKKLDKQSEEAVLEAIQKMKEEAAGAGLDGALSRLHDSFHFSPNPLKLFGAGPAINNASRVSPLVNALDQRVGTGASAATAAVQNAVKGQAPDRTSDLLRVLGLQ